MPAEIITKEDFLEFAATLKGMDHKIRNVKKFSDELESGSEKISLVINEKQESFINEISVVREEIKSLKDDVKTIQKILIEIIAAMRSSVKIDEFERLKKRIDTWSPESMVSRQEAERIIESE